MWRYSSQVEALPLPSLGKSTSVLMLIRGTADVGISPQGGVLRYSHIKQCGDSLT